MSVRCGERDVRIKVLIDPFVNGDLPIGVGQEHLLHYAPSYLEVKPILEKRLEGRNWEVDVDQPFPNSLAVVGGDGTEQIALSQFIRQDPEISRRTLRDSRLDETDSQAVDETQILAIPPHQI